MSNKIKFAGRFPKKLGHEAHRVTFVAIVAIIFALYSYWMCPRMPILDTRNGMALRSRLIDYHGGKHIYM